MQAQGERAIVNYSRELVGNGVHEDGCALNQGCPNRSTFSTGRNRGYRSLAVQI
jgi:hypothetical protein